MKRSNLRSAQPHRLGFTLLELLVAIVLIGILIMMLLPTVRRVRPAARRANCENNIRQLALAALNYEATHGKLPPAMGMPQPYDGTAEPDANRLSGLIHILPFLEQQALYDAISNPSEHNGVEYTAFGAAPWDQNFPAWKTQLPHFSCPSAMEREDDSDFGWTGYAFSIGDQARSIHNTSPTRGAFAMGQGSTTESIRDGTSYTIAFAEMGTNNLDNHPVSRYLANQPDIYLDNPGQIAKDHPVSDRRRFLKSDQLAPLGRGHCWADGGAGVSLVNTILPPNSPSAAVGGEIAVDGIYSAGSFHGGGVTVAFADGHVRFIDEDIDAGDSSTPTPTVEQMGQPGFASPYGVWGALGTAAGTEAVDSYTW